MPLNLRSCYDQDQSIDVEVHQVGRILSKLISCRVGKYPTFLLDIAISRIPTGVAIAQEEAFDVLLRIQTGWRPACISFQYRSISSDKKSVMIALVKLEI